MEFSMEIVAVVAKVVVVEVEDKTFINTCLPTLSHRMAHKAEKHYEKKQEST